MPAGKSVEVYGSIVDRRSVKDVRIGVDGSRMFRVGDVAYQNTASLAFRTFIAREFKEGRGEWEAEVAYITTKDDQAGVVCSVNVIADCFGSAKTSAYWWRMARMRIHHAAASSSVRPNARGTMKVRVR